MSHLLGGRVICRQPATGHRSGIEPVLLAASVPARAGQRVLEAGSGPGSALLCLLYRVPGVAGLGEDIEPGLVSLARDNVSANGFDGLRFEARDITEPGGEAPFDHAIANPPWHDSAATASPDARRDRARRAGEGLIARWTIALGRRLRHRGTLTLVIGAGHFHDVIAALPAAGCGAPALMPLWPRAGVAAKLVLVRAIRGARGPARLLPGLVLHDTAGAFTPEADAILRDGAALPL